MSLRLPPSARWSSLTLQNDAQSLSYPMQGSDAANVSYEGGGGTGIAMWYDAAGRPQTTYLSFVDANLFGGV